MVKDSYRFALVTQDEKLLKTNFDHRSRYLNQIHPPLLHGAGLMVGRLKCSSRGLGLSPVAGSLCYVLKQNSPCQSHQPDVKMDICELSGKPEKI